MWALKQLCDKGLLYEGYRVLPYCWECETPLSNFETRQDDAYRDRQDPAVTVAFELEPGRRAGPSGSWRGRPRRGRCRPTWPSPSAPTSTTPSSRGRPPRTSSARAAAATYASELEGAVLVAHRARARAGRAALHAAVPLLRRHARTPSGSSAADFVSTEEGTGVVHMAPGFGEDDQRAVRGGRHPGGLPGRQPGPVHRRGARLRGPAGVRRQPAGHRATCEPGACSSATTPTSTPTRTAGGPTRR